MKPQAGAHKRRLFRRKPSEALATALIGLGMAMLVQPFWVALFTWSFPVILAGTVLFVAGSHFPD